MQSTPTEQVVPEVADVTDLEAALKDLIARRAFDELLTTVLRLVDSLRKDNDRLRLEVQALKHKLYSRKSEKRPVKPAEENKVPDKAESAVAATPEPPKPSGSHGRGTRPEHMPAVLVEIPLTPSQRACPACQSEMIDATAAPAWRVEFVPGYFRVEDLRMQRVGCPPCTDRRSEFAQAKTPKVIKGSPVGAGLLGRVLTDGSDLTH